MMAGIELTLRVSAVVPGYLLGSSGCRVWGLVVQLPA